MNPTGDAAGEAAGRGAGSPTSTPRPAIATIEACCRAALWLLIGGFAAYAVHRAFTLRIDYWDSFLFLNNARRMLGDPWARYTLDKPPLLPILYMPALMTVGTSGTAVARLIVPHLEAVALAMLAVASVWAALRRPLGQTLALAGALLFMANRVFVHYVAFSLSDIASVGFVAGVYAVWLKARVQPRWSWFTLTGVLIASAVATRYQAATLPFAIAGAELVIALRDRRFNDRRALGFAFAATLGFVLWLLVHKYAYEAVDRPWGARSLLDALEYAGAGALREYEREAPWQYFRMLPIAVSPIVLGGAVLGLLVAARDRRDEDYLFFFWLVALGGGLFRVDHNEIRYLMTAFPAMIYFALRTVETVRASSVFRKPGRGWLGLSLSVLALAVALVPAVDQAIKDQRPFFFADQYRAAAEWMRNRRVPEARMVWHGRPLTLHPENPMQFEDDEYFNVFHHYAHIVEYFSGGRLEEWPWRGPDGGRVVRAHPRDRLVFLQGANDDLHAWEIEANGKPSESFETWASIPHAAERRPGGFFDGERRLLRFEEGEWRAEVAGGWLFVKPTGEVLSDGVVRLAEGDVVDVDLDGVDALTMIAVDRASFGVERTTNARPASDRRTSEPRSGVR